MLGFVAMGDVIHAAEDRLAAAKGVEVQQRAAAKAVLAALDKVAEWLRGDLAEGDGALTAVKERLSAAIDERKASTDVPPAPAVEHSAQDDAAAPKAAQQWVQVNVRRVDDLSERMASFEADFRALYYKLRAHAGAARSDRSERSDRTLRPLLADFDRCQANLDEITTATWALRLVPVEPVLSELVRHARSLAQDQRKAVHITVQGGDAQLERSVLDSILDPLLHLVRNAVDHGIELPHERGKKGEARLTISAEASGANIVFVIADDGRGIDPAKVRTAAVARGVIGADAADDLSDQALRELLFVHGFSTRTQVTELSGRGVGLDVVRSAVEAVGGVVGVASEVGKGTRFTLTLPATISKEKNLVVDGGNDRLYAIPSRHVVTILRLADQRIETVAGGNAIRVRDTMVPLRSLGDLLRRGGPADEAWVVVVENGDYLWAFSVARLLGEYSLLRRPIDRIVGAVGLIAASATFEDGRLVLILSVSGLVGQSRGGRMVGPPAAAAPRIVRVLVVDDSAVVRDSHDRDPRPGGLRRARRRGGRPGSVARRGGDARRHSARRRHARDGRIRGAPPRA